MAYDKDLDKEIFKESVEFDNSNINVSIFSYNDGIPKIQISRELKDSEGNLKWSKLGRMTKDEVQNVIPALQKALENM